jgi:hypothetical protein
VLIMTARPGHLAKEFIVELPRPRELDMQTSPYFITAVKEIKAIIHAGTEVE